MAPKTTTDEKRTMLEMFADGTTGESYYKQRLVTTETDSGSVALIAYGWIKLAEYNERRGVVTVFTGHRAIESKVLNRWISDVIDVVGERRDVVVSGESPCVDTPNEGVKYVGSYIDFSTRLSGVEKSAIKTVEKSIEFFN